MSMRALSKAPAMRWAPTSTRQQLRSYSSASSNAAGSNSSNKPPSKHKLFYRELAPPITKVLAYSSIVYFGLHLTWSLLEREERKHSDAFEIRKLQEETKAAVAKAEKQASDVAAAVQQKGKSWWSWATGR